MLPAYALEQFAGMHGAHNASCCLSNNYGPLSVGCSDLQLVCTCLTPTVTTKASIDRYIVMCLCKFPMPPVSSVLAVGVVCPLVCYHSHMPAATHVQVILDRVSSSELKELPRCKYLLPAVAPGQSVVYQA